MNAAIHGVAAQGPSKTLVRDENWIAYGVNANASMPTAIPGPRTPNVRRR